MRWITGVSSDDIAAIMPCTALYVQPCSHTLYVQYTRVSSCFFTIILYCKQAYLTWEKWVQCAYGVFLHCTECALNNGCLRVPSMAGSLRYRRIKHPCFYAHSEQCKRTLYSLIPYKIHLLTVHNSVEKAAWNSCILKRECRATFWLQVECCTEQDRCDILG